jgi:hypothetical protein
VFLLSCATAFAQGGSLTGVVVDANGGMIPGVSVVVKSNATNRTFESVTNAEGLFSVPALDAGTYTVTVSLTGFKTAVLNDVRIAPANPTSVKAVLEVGSVSETINVTSSSEIINTQTATIAATLNVDQINKMPLPTRNALNAVTFLPGVNTEGINRDSEFNGLPQSFINITLDGVSNNDNFNKSTDGFFAMVTPRQDAVEAVSVTTATGGADVGGHGAVAISFQTRSGTNRFTGSAYEYFRHPSLNSNYYFNRIANLPRNDIKLNQYGFRQGGPIILPGLFNGRDKAFFFVNYEELRLPNNFTRTRTVLHPDAQRGIFRYQTASGVQTVDVLALAARNGHVSAIEPLVQRTLGFINSATGSGGTLRAQTDPLLTDYVWQSPGNQVEYQPVVRLDYNVNDANRLSWSSNWVKVVRDPDHLNSVDARFPGSPNYRKYVSTRPLNSFSLRSTLTNPVVNEARGGVTRGGASYFGQTSSNGPQTFDDLGGFALDFDRNIGLTNWFATNAPTWRNAYQYTVEDNLTWQRGSHGISLGGAVFLGRVWEAGQQMVPQVNLGFNQDFDPAAGLFTTANLQGASTANLADARDLYALLTGRVFSITGQAALDENTNEYVAFGPRKRAGKMNEYSLFLQDSWRATPTLTLNGGLRWDLQMPFSPVNDIMSSVSYASACGVSGIRGDGRCNFFAPGSTAGPSPVYDQFSRGSLGYKTDKNNFGPTVGIAWRPNVQDGFMRTLLGDPDQATLRAGYSVAYERQGMGVFTGQFGANPGSTLSLTRDANTGLVPAGESWPVLVNQPQRLYNAPFPNAPTYPIVPRAGRSDSVDLFHPDIEIASARSWTVSLQRSLTRNMAIDVRYVGTRGVNQWTEVNYNERNLIENKFIDEFRLAMANLQANNAAGGTRSGSFAYFGSGTGTNPLPIYLAYLNGRTDAGNAAAYAGTNWTNSTLAGRFVKAFPDPNGSATDLDGNATRRASAIAAGLAANFFVLNPTVNEVNVYESKAFSDYHALQIELKRRLANGLQVNGSYQYAYERGSVNLGEHFGRVLDPTDNVRHAFKTQWNYSLPIGRGQRFGANLHPLLNALLGGWEFNGNGRVQARTVNFGNVRLVGMSIKDVTSMYKYRRGSDPTTGEPVVTVLPEDVILNTRRAWSFSATSANGYSALGAPEGRYFAPPNTLECQQLKNGECAPRYTLFRTPFFTRFDMAFGKRFPIRGNTNFEVRLDILNVFDNINFEPYVPRSNTRANTIADYSSGAFAQTDDGYTDLSNTFDPGGRLGMLVFRVNW